MSHDVDDAAARVEAVEALLVEKGLIDPAVVDEVIEHYETNVGPLNGAKIVARAWTDPAYRERLLADGTEAVAEFGLGGVEGQMIIAVENTPEVHNVVVCTLCSCYPWPVLGPAARLVQVGRVPLAHGRPAARHAPGDGPRTARRCPRARLGQLGGGPLHGAARAPGRHRRSGARRAREARDS